MLGDSDRVAPGSHDVAVVSVFARVRMLEYFVTRILENSGAEACGSCRRDKRLGDAASVQCLRCCRSKLNAGSSSAGLFGPEYTVLLL